eukprot:401705-Pyramimonas_sp.AAC.1
MEGGSCSKCGYRISAVHIRCQSCNSVKDVGGIRIVQQLHGWRVVPFYLAAKTDRFLVGSKESILTPQVGLGGCREKPGNPGTPQDSYRFLSFPMDSY